MTVALAGPKAGPNDASDRIAPDCRGRNFFDVDPSLRGLPRPYLPDDLRTHMEPRFRRLGELAGGRLDELSRLADWLAATDVGGGDAATSVRILTPLLRFRACRDNIAVATGALYQATRAGPLASEGARVGRDGGDARRLVLARTVVDHRLRPRDPLAAGFDDGAAVDAVPGDAPVDLETARPPVAA